MLFFDVIQYSTDLIDLLTHDEITIHVVFFIHFFLKNCFNFYLICPLSSSCSLIQQWNNLNNYVYFYRVS